MCNPEPNLLLLLPAHHELDTPVAGHVRSAVVGRDRSHRTIAHGFQALLLDARLDQIRQHGACALGGKAPVSLSAPLRAGVARNFDVHFRTGFCGTGDAIEQREAGAVELGATDTKMDGADTGHLFQLVLTGTEAGRRAYV